jgi:hypothetical protein
MPIRFLLAASMVASTLGARIPPITIPARSESITVDVDLAQARPKLLAAASAQTKDILLDLDAIEAERSPGVYFEVFVHAKGADRGRTVGNLALYGSGIRSEARGAFRPAHIQLVVTDDFRDALPKSPTITIEFVARGAGGTATTARSACEVRIGKPAILFTPRTRG